MIWCMIWKVILRLVFQKSPSDRHTVFPQDLFRYHSSFLDQLARKRLLRRLGTDIYNYVRGGGVWFERLRCVCISEIQMNTTLQTRNPSNRSFLRDDFWGENRAIYVLGARDLSCAVSSASPLVTSSCCRFRSILPHARKKTCDTQQGIRFIVLLNCPRKGNGGCLRLLFMQWG